MILKIVIDDGRVKFDRYRVNKVRSLENSPVVCGNNE